MAGDWKELGIPGCHLPQSRSASIARPSTTDTIDLLPDREVATVVAWLSQYPMIDVVSRDSSRRFAQAISAALSDAQRVLDRFHTTLAWFVVRYLTISLCAREGEQEHVQRLSAVRRVLRREGH